MGDNLTETVGHVKESVVGSINGMANSINDVISDGMTKIPLKDASTKIEETVDSKNHLIEENLENLKNEMLTKAQSMGDEADKIADELIKDTEDVIRDAETGITNAKDSAMETMETVKDDVMDVIKGNDVFSVDSLGTFAAEPEIEKLINGEPEKPLSPEATEGELDDLNEMNSEEPSAPPVSMDVPEAPEPSSLPAEKPMEESLPAMADMVENTATSEAESSIAPASEVMEMKKEDDLVVEDVKSTDE
jgi:phage-related protein